MAEPYLRRGEVLMRLETLYFQPRKKHGVAVTPHLLITVLQGKNNFSRLYLSLGL